MRCTFLAFITFPFRYRGYKSLTDSGLSYQLRVSDSEPSSHVFQLSLHTSSGREQPQTSGNVAQSRELVLEILSFRFLYVQNICVCVCVSSFYSLSSASAPKITPRYYWTHSRDP